jgi:small-conductance mechanosensitive channel
MTDGPMPSVGDWIAMGTALLTGGATYGTLHQRIKTLETSSEKHDAAITKQSYDQTDFERDVSERLTRLEANQQNTIQLLTEVRSALFTDTIKHRN